MPRMRLLWVSFGGGRTVWTLLANFSHVVTYDVTHEAATGLWPLMSRLYQVPAFITFVPSGKFVHR